MTQIDIQKLTEKDIDALLDLQHDNLLHNIDSVTKESQGFLSFTYTPTIIKEMMAHEPQIIAKQKDLIVGYALTTSLNVGMSIPQMLPLIKKCETITYHNAPLSQYDIYIMGQICVRAGYRGIGVFDALYEGHKQFLASKYRGVLTEISCQNKRSLAAHRRVGFDVIHEYYDEVSNKDWAIVIWDWQND